MDGARSASRGEGREERRELPSVCEGKLPFLALHVSFVKQPSAGRQRGALFSLSRLNPTVITLNVYNLI